MNKETCFDCREWEKQYKELELDYMFLREKLSLLLETIIPYMPEDVVVTMKAELDNVMGKEEKKTNPFKVVE